MHSYVLAKHLWSSFLRFPEAAICRAILTSSFSIFKVSVQLVFQYDNNQRKIKRILNSVRFYWWPWIEKKYKIYSMLIKNNKPPLEINRYSIRVVISI